MDIKSVFKTVRNIPYRIPVVLGEKDDCCSGKNKALKDLLNKQGLEVRYRVCGFLWSTIDLPKKVSKIPHDDYSTHLYLEALINKKWVIIDATWDIGLKNIFHINKWDGKSNTEIAVKPIEIFSPQKSADIMNSENIEEMKKDRKVNGRFYEAFNNWLNEVRRMG
ncbi:MAG: hypothetical protein NTZ49_01020 [Candidatus Parcubacteria bacterium]|nr:hypothetical protein [Candidatus Parcubacteria bacterium]